MFDYFTGSGDFWKLKKYSHLAAPTTSYNYMDPKGAAGPLRGDWKIFNVQKAGTTDNTISFM